MQELWENTTLGEEKLSSVAHSNTSGSSESQRRIKKRSKTTPIKLSVTSKTKTLLERHIMHFQYITHLFPRS